MEGIRYWIEAEGNGHWFFIAFPVILLCLFIWFKGRRVRFLIPALIISIVIINPWFYQKWDGLGLYAYWRILWVVPVIPVVAGIVPSITERIRKTWIKSVVAAAGVGMIAIAGTFLYNGAGGSFVEAANAAKLPDDVVQIADRLLELDEHPRVIAQDPIAVYIRQYVGEIDTLYGRDVSGYIFPPSIDVMNIHNQLSHGDMNGVAQLMLDDGYDYLVFNGDVGEQFVLVDNSENYGIYKANGLPMVIKERNELGQVISVTTIDENGQSIDNDLDCIKVSYLYDKNGNVIRKYGYDEYGNPTTNDRGIAGYEWVYDNQSRVVRKAFLGTNGKYVKDTDVGYAVKEIRWNNNNYIIGENYFDEYGHPIITSSGYAGWERGENTIYLFDEDGALINGISSNIAEGIWFDSEGWSTWMTPKNNINNSTFNIGSICMNDHEEGEQYSCQIEIEFKNVSSTENEEFWFITQGAQDGQWYTGNIWNSSLVEINEVPEDGVYSYISTVTVHGEMTKVKKFTIGFRCDNWASGSFRVRNIKVEKGPVVTAWTPGCIE